jgi:hypothetical protein
MPHHFENKNNLLIYFPPHCLTHKPPKENIYVFFCGESTLLEILGNKIQCWRGESEYGLGKANAG